MQIKDYGIVHGGSRPAVRRIKDYGIVHGGSRPAVRGVSEHILTADLQLHDVQHRP
jgi:hypothetical protein